MREPIARSLPLRRAVPIAAAAGLLGALVLALVAPRALSAQGPRGVPRGHLPPPGLCRVWYDQLPPGNQPRVTDCASARAEAWRTGGRVIVGRPGDDRDGWGDRRAGRDDAWWWGRDRDRDDDDDRRRRDRWDDDRRDGGWKRAGARVDDRRDRERWERERRDRERWERERWERERRDRERKRDQIARARGW